MNQHDKKSWVGQLSLDLLFEGSKSEAFYPVLHCEDGVNYRVYLKGVDSLDKAVLNHFMGQRVAVFGYADDLRGHWRLVVDAKDSGFLTEQPALPSEQAPANNSLGDADE